MKVDGSRMTMHIYVIYGDDFGERVVGNLMNFSTFCTSCGETCGNCRLEYGSFSSDIVGADRIPANLPTFIEETEKYFPKNPPKCEIIIAVGLHQDLLASIPILVEKTQAKGVIVPLEEAEWCPTGLQKQVEEELNSMGVAHAFPKPFCTLEESGHNTIIDEFIKRYKVGKPIVEVTVNDDIITKTKVIRSAPMRKYLVRYEADRKEKHNERFKRKNLRSPPLLPLHSQHASRQNTRRHNTPRGRIHHQRSSTRRHKQSHREKTRTDTTPFKNKNRPNHINQLPQPHSNRTTHTNLVLKVPEIVII